MYNLLFPPLHDWGLIIRVFSFLKVYGFYQAAWHKKEGGASDLRGILLILLLLEKTLLSFLLHFLCDLLHSPKGSWLGTEDSTAHA